VSWLQRYRCASPIGTSSDILSLHERSSERVGYLVLWFYELNGTHLGYAESGKQPQVSDYHPTKSQA
jgi:hypothetical protein